jgi:hypothetical protein
MAADKQAIFGQTLLLLGLWDLGGLQDKVTKGKVLSRVKKKGEKAADYVGLVDRLAADGAIAISGKSNAAKYSLTPKGLQMLGTGLHDPAFTLGGTIVATKIANSLLRWLKEMSVSQDSGENTIDSYDAFKTILLETVDRLNRDFNFGNLVPIYRIRREIGDRLERAKFNEWLMEMQAQDIVQLLEGTVEDSALDKIEDSIVTKVSGLRCFVKVLNN